MADSTRVGIIGAGWPGLSHAKAYAAAGGFKVVAVADLIPSRRQQIMKEVGATKEFADPAQLIADKEIDAVSICTPNHLHAPLAIAAMRAGKHVVCEKPPALNAQEARRMALSAEKNGRVLLYGVQRRFGGPEQAARQAIEKGYAGDIFHARSSWLRTRGMPRGTGWFTDKARSGGGAMVDIGVPMLDLAWFLMGQPKPTSVLAVTHTRFAGELAEGQTCDVDDSAFALVRFEGGKSLEISASWALNQPPQQNGTLCRLFGQTGAVDVYTAQGAVLYRQFTDKGESKAVALKPPKTVGHVAMMRHFRECILGKATPLVGGKEGLALMEIMDGIYKSAATGKSVGM